MKKIKELWLNILIIFLLLVLVILLLFRVIEVHGWADGWGSFFGGVVGGILTLSGVFMTIRHYKKSDKNSEEKQKKLVKPILKYQVGGQLFHSRDRNVYKTTINPNDDEATESNISGTTISIQNISKSIAENVRVYFQQNDLGREDIKIAFAQALKENETIILDLKFVNVSRPYSFEIKYMDILENNLSEAFIMPDI